MLLFVSSVSFQVYIEKNTIKVDLDQNSRFLAVSSPIFSSAPVCQTDVTEINAKLSGVQ